MYGHQGPSRSVVFVDDGRWISIFQTAAQLRRRGWHTVRVTSDRSPFVRQTSRLVFHEFHALGEDPAAHLAELLAGREVADIQFVETLAESVLAASHVLDEGLAEVVRRRARYMDKVEGGSLLAARAVPQPARRLLREGDPREMARELGYPVVAKGRVGYGGATVVILADESELLTWLAGEPQGDGYLERFVPGEVLGYGAVAGPGGEVMGDVLYRCLDGLGGTGPPERVEVVDLPEVVAIGRTVVGAVGAPGPVNLNLVNGPDGSQLIDLNLRVFGAMPVLGALGFDAVGAWCAQMEGAPFASGPLGGQTDIFPTPVHAAIAAKQRGRAVALFLRGALGASRRVGWRYVLSEAVALGASPRR